MGLFSKVGKVLDSTIDSVSETVSENIDKVKEKIEPKYRFTDENITDPDNVNTFVGSLDEVFKILKEHHKISIEKIDD
jgi:uncharacterized protein YqgV (UPF0045/DUF77 family)